MTRAGVRFQYEKRRRLARQAAQQRDQQRVLHAIGEIAGMERVAIVHGAMASKGQRGRGAKSISSVKPRRRRSSAAQATITALSVHKRIGGATSRKPCATAARCRAARTAWFAA